MRTTGLLIVCLITLSFPALAVDPTEEDSSARPVPAISANSTGLESAVLTQRRESDLSRRGQGPTENYNDGVCATMRTYVVARENPRSDTTDVVGYARCQPAWKFRLRTADQNDKAATR